MQMKLDLLTEARPDLCVDISQLAQITESAYDENPEAVAKRFNTAIKYANGNLVHN